MDMTLIVLVEVVGAVAVALGLPAIILGHRRRMRELRLEEEALELRRQELQFRLRDDTTRQFP